MKGDKGIILLEAELWNLRGIMKRYDRRTAPVFRGRRIYSYNIRMFITEEV